MLDSTNVLQGLTLLFLAVGTYLLHLLRTGTEAAVKKTAEEAAQEAIDRFKWPAELARELQKSRGVERQELRFKSYGALWNKLRPLAIYDSKPLGKVEVAQLSEELSNWYFSECGGLLLTPQTRDFYFALQDILRATSRATEDWSVERPDQLGDIERSVFEDLLKATASVDAVSAFEYVTSRAPSDWQETAAEFAAKWRRGINGLGRRWPELSNPQRFSTLQQVGSVLRTSLTIDLESRVL